MGERRTEGNQLTTLNWRQAANLSTANRGQVLNVLVHRLAYNGDVVAFKMVVGKAVRAGLVVEGAYLDRYVTDEQRSRRPIFNATLRAAAGWLFFRVARSTRMNSDMGASLPPVRLGPP